MIKQSYYNLDFCNNIGKDSDIKDFEFDLHSIKESYKNNFEKNEYYKNILMEWRKLNILKKRIVIEKIKKSSGTDWLEIIRKIKSGN